MAKRFTDTDKFKKAFMRGLPGPYKLLWDYICLDCNHAGIWHVDFQVAQIYLGPDMPINPETALRLFNATEARIQVLAGGLKWFIKPFIEFQYKVPAEQLNPKNKAHSSAIAVLLKEGAYIPLASPYLGAKDKDKDKDSSKDVKDVAVKAVGVDVGGSGGFDFNAAWARYPRKLGRKDAQRHFNASVKTPQDYADLQNAIDCFTREMRKEGRADDKIPYGSTWFFNWRDWVNYGGVKMPAPPPPKPRPVEPPPEEMTDDDLREIHAKTVGLLKICRDPGCRFCKKDVEAGAHV